MLDLEQLPYRPHLDRLSALRASDAPWASLAFEEAQSAERGTYDANEGARACLAHVLLLRGEACDAALVRFLLEQEVTARTRDSFQGAGGTLTILSALLLEWAPPDPDDIWLFWTAKRANFDTAAGGYDIEFVFAQHAPSVVRDRIRARGTPEDQEAIAAYDVDDIVDGLPAWRASLARRYARTLEAMTAAEAEAWAEQFGDEEGQERFGLLRATTPEARARLYRRLGRFEAAVPEWEAAAREAESPWDQASRLQSALTDAAKVPMALSSAVEALDALRDQIPSWNEVGLGRMATQACFEHAAALDGDAGHHSWSVAERWHRDLGSFPLVGRRAALAAAKKWGSASDVDRLQVAVDEEHQRIYGPDATT